MVRKIDFEYWDAIDNGHSSTGAAFRFWFLNIRVVSLWYAVVTNMFQRTPISLEQ